MKLKERLSDESIERVAIVGLPCQAQFLWQMRMYPMLETDFSGKITFVVSLFCLGTFATEAFLNYLKTYHGIDPESVESINIVGDYIEHLERELKEAEASLEQLRINGDG